VQKYIIKLCRKYNIKIKSKKLLERLPKHLVFQNKRDRFSLQDFEEDEKLFLETFKYYNLEIKPFSIYKYKKNGGEECSHSKKNKELLRKSKKMIFKIQKIPKIHSFYSNNYYNNNNFGINPLQTNLLNLNNFNNLNSTIPLFPNNINSNSSLNLDPNYLTLLMQQEITNLLFPGGVNTFFVPQQQISIPSFNNNLNTCNTLSNDQTNINNNLLYTNTNNNDFPLDQKILNENNNQNVWSYMDNIYKNYQALNNIMSLNNNIDLNFNSS
jgi:hypothetical protein